MIEIKHAIEKDGKFWGVQYEDGRSTERGWGSILKADFVNPAYCRRPEDATYRGSADVKRLKEGRIVKVKIETTIIG